MTPDRLASILNRLDWSVDRTAQEVDCNERVVRRWVSGANPVPVRIATWLESLVAVLDAVPPPPADKRNAA